MSNDILRRLTFGVKKTKHTLQQVTCGFFINKSYFSQIKMKYLKRQLYDYVLCLKIFEKSLQNYGSACQVKLLLWSRRKMKVQVSFLVMSIASKLQNWNSLPVLSSLCPILIQNQGSGKCQML